MTLAEVLSDLDSPDEEVRRGACRAVAQSGDSQAIDALMSSVATRDPATRAIAIEELTAALPDRTRFALATVGQPAKPGLVEPRLRAKCPDGWWWLDSLTMRAPDDEANLIFSTEELPSGTDARAYAEQTATAMAGETAGYERIELGPAKVFGGEDGWVHEFTRADPGGPPVHQRQAYAVKDGRGFVATATRTLIAPSRRQAELESAFDELRIGAPRSARSVWAGRTFTALVALLCIALIAFLLANPPSADDEPEITVTIPQTDPFPAPPPVSQPGGGERGDR